MSKIIWEDRKRIFGLPISFTKYKLTEEQLFIQTGLLNLNTESVKLFRVLDISLSQSLVQRIFNCGTITLTSIDSKQSSTKIQFVKYPVKLYETIDKLVTVNRNVYNVRTTEFINE